MPIVDDAFRYLKRCYFNRVRLQVRLALSRTPTLEGLRQRFFELNQLGYDSSTIAFTARLIQELTPAGTPFVLRPSSTS